MSLQKLAESLHPLERKLLPHLEKSSSFSELLKLSQMLEVEAMRALQWLQNKNIVKIEQSSKKSASLDSNGIKYRQEGLPEKKLLQSLIESPLTILQITKKTGLSSEEINISLGILRGKSAIFIKKEKEVVISITEQGKDSLNKNLPDELFLKKKFPILLEALSQADIDILEGLKKRKNILRIEDEKKITAELTPTGKDLIQIFNKSDYELVDSITNSILKSCSWKNKKFRRYDLNVQAPKIFAGRKQHYRRFLDDVRRKFLSLGFTEMSGPVVETDFWDMDSLFMPQFHSARDIHQGYYIKQPKYSTVLPKELVNRVKKSHETGVAGSTGWKYDFDVKRTHRHILRTHDTSISSRTLASKDLKIPGKYFQIARCFRYDVIDATHLSDFNQVGGFVIEEGINFRHLKGILKMFAEEFAETDKIKIVPAYFPFTEPSAQLFAKHPDMGWIELAGAGIFRPEMVVPLVGKEIPVIAWGVGLDRLAMFKLGIKDIRQLFSHDLDFLRNIQLV